MTLPDFPDDLPGGKPAAAPPRPAPVKFDANLVPRLLTAQRTLIKRFGELVPLAVRAPAANTAPIDECAKQFSAMRHIETIWLYPAIAHAVAGDSAAASLFAELRLVGLMYARRAQRCFDELLQAIRAEVLVQEAADRANQAIARYAAHSERAVYPLYAMIGTAPAADRVA
jgi:hypothetical protein